MSCGICILYPYLPANQRTFTTILIEVKLTPKSGYGRLVVTPETFLHSTPIAKTKLT